MAANTLKRQAVKYIRDGVKANYPEKVDCAICGTKEKLELHHFTSVSLLFWDWQKKKGYPVDTVDQIMDIRDEFYDTFWTELTEEVVTLCNPHHTRLHEIYGSIPALSSAKKQERWVALQRRDHGLDPLDLIKKPIEEREDTDVVVPTETIEIGSDDDIARICRLWSN